MLFAKKPFLKVLTLAGFLVLLSCDDRDNLNVTVTPTYLRYAWEPVIDSLTNIDFSNLDISLNGELYVNYWKWNTPGSDFPPATLISHDGHVWRWIPDSSPIHGTWNYLKRHKNRLWGRYSL